MATAQDTIAMAKTPELSGLQFEREKWQGDMEMRRRELALKEREQSNKDAEIELKRAEQASSKWRNPLVVAIFAAAVAAGGNAVVAVVNGSLQRDLESSKRDAEIVLENSKAESTRILEMIKTGDTEKAAGNLEFLLKSGLIVEPMRAAKLTAFLADRKPGAGPSLPASNSRIAFEATDLLTETIQANLQKQLDSYIAYLGKIGFSNLTERVIIKVDKFPTPTAYYDPSAKNIVLDIKMVADPHVAMREYNHHVLLTNHRIKQPFSQYAAIESGLADYFASSFLNNPRVGEIAAKNLNLNRAYIRNLANERKFGQFKSIGNEMEIPYEGAEIWGGAFWEIRDKVGRDVADPVFVAAWITVSNEESLVAADFVKAVVSTAESKGDARVVDIVQSVLRTREFPLAR
jgi:hypothetical protein